MKSIFFSIALLFTTAVHAEDKSFYSVELGQGWKTFGTIFEDKDTSDKCSAQRIWEDGSIFQLTKNLNSGALYIWILNSDWSITDQPETKLDVQINTFVNRKFIKGGTLEFTLVNKNTMYSSSLDVDKFVDAFFKSQRMLLIPPGTIPNMNVFWGDLNNRIINSLGECVKKGLALLNKKPTDTPATGKGFKVTPDISPLTGKKGEPI